MKSPDLNRTSRLGKEHWTICPEPGERFITKHYTCISREWAKRLANLDGTPLEDIEYTPSVFPIHNTELWVWWGDGKITSMAGMPHSLNCKSLSRSAQKLIDKSWKSACGSPSCDWETLARVEKILNQEQMAVGPSQGGRPPEVLQCLLVKYTNGELGRLYVFFSAEKTDTYYYNVSLDFPVNRLRGSTIFGDEPAQQNPVPASAA